jgi:excisionase family DNA binding protein
MVTNGVEDAAVYVEGALVTGHAAHVMDRILRSPNVAAVLTNLPQPLRSEVLATASAISRAARAWERLPLSPERSDETPLGEIEALSVARSELLTTKQVAEQLGVSSRRVQQLAAGGLGSFVGRQWLFDQDVVRAYASTGKEAV